MTQNPSNRTCSNCGAAVARLDARFCEYCGHELPRPEPPPTAARPPGPFGDLEARFAALQQHADLGQLMRLSPKLAGFGCGLVFSIGFLVLFSTVAMVIVAGVWSMGAPKLFLMVPVFFIAFAVMMTTKMLSRAGKYRNAPLQRVPALVVGERADVSGGGQSSARTSYYLTLEFPNGARREYETEGRVCGQASQGDMGVAYLKGEYLIDFQRLRV